MNETAQARAVRALKFLLGGGGLQLLSTSLWAATCTVSASGIAFGGYDPFVNQDVDSVANISVNCDATTSYSIALSTGTGSYDSRVMTSGIHQLLYNLYIDATLTTVWGDGTGHSAIVSDTQAVANHTVYPTTNIARDRFDTSDE